MCDSLTDLIQTTRNHSFCHHEESFLFLRINIRRRLNIILQWRPIKHLFLRSTIIEHEWSSRSPLKRPLSSIQLLLAPGHMNLRQSGRNKIRKRSKYTHNTIDWFWSLIFNRNNPLKKFQGRRFKVNSMDLFLCTFILIGFKVLIDVKSKQLFSKLKSLIQWFIF